jgi:hypothetical protein
VPYSTRAASNQCVDGLDMKGLDEAIASLTYLHVYTNDFVFSFARLIKQH